MMPSKTLENVALWFTTGVAGLGALGFGINALTTLMEHPENTGELYGMATASALCVFVFSYVRGIIRDRQETARNAALVGAVTHPALHAGAPDWSTAPPGEAVPERIERDCPYCAERILVAAKLCKHCHSDVSSA